MKLYSLVLLLQDAATETSFTNELVRRFNEGGGFMWPVLICLVIGLAIGIERIITLNMADTNTRKFLARVKTALDEGGISRALEVCENTRGPVASVFHAGLLRADEGITAVEKAVVSYGSIEMSFLERGLVWLSLFIAAAPMLGFLGTVVGMVEAFDAIESAGDISPSLVAGGIKVALLDDGRRPHRRAHPAILLQLRDLQDRPDRGRDGGGVGGTHRLARADGGEPPAG